MHVKFERSLDQKPTIRFVCWRFFSVVGFLFFFLCIHGRTCKIGQRSLDIKTTLTRYSKTTPESSMEKIAKEIVEL
jgi:hypothetical protein